MQLSDFDFDFPPELIAERPLPRGESRMMVLHRADRPDAAATGPDEPIFSHTRHLIDHLSPGDLLVLNDTKVLPARLHGRLDTGGTVELLLLEQTGDVPTEWNAMARPARKLREGREFDVGGVTARVTGILEDGRRRIRFVCDAPDFAALLERHGEIPLPPYIRRKAEPEDAVRYQSVFAKVPGAVAAPTASLHLSQEALDAIAAKGVGIAHVTLHVGAGTFKPVDVERVEDYHIHAERFEVGPAAVEALSATRARGGRIWAVGTTVARVLETMAEMPQLEPTRGITSKYILPGYEWRLVDGLLTNFHWPKSTLFMLVCSLLGTAWARESYAQAVAERMRLFSFGDAMLIKP